MTETESQAENDVFSGVGEGIQLTVNGDVAPFPVDTSAAVVKSLRRQLARAKKSGRRGEVRDQLRADVHHKPGEILDAIWTNKTAVALLLVGAGGALLTASATLHR